MQRMTISLDDDLLETIDRLSERRGYASRSEALRDIIRDAAMREKTESSGSSQCFAALSYVFDHETRDLARRLTTTQHHHHDLSVSTLHVHVSERECLEVAVLKGEVDAVRAFADGVVTQRGVRFGHLHLVPVEAEAGHSHSGETHRHPA